MSEVFFKIKLPFFLGYFDPKNNFFIMEICNFRGDLSDISAKTATLELMLPSCPLPVLYISPFGSFQTLLPVYPVLHFMDMHVSHVKIEQRVCEAMFHHVDELHTVSENIRQSQAVLPFSKSNKMIFGYFDPENIFLDNKNN